MIPVMLAEVPSMHICIHYLDEFLAIPNLKPAQFSFIVYLACYLGLQYPMESTLTICSNLLSRLSAILPTVDQSVREHYPTWIMLMYKGFFVMKEKIIRNIQKMKESIAGQEGDFKEKCKTILKKLDALGNDISSAAD